MEIEITAGSIGKRKSIRPADHRDPFELAQRLLRHAGKLRREAAVDDQPARAAVLQDVVQHVAGIGRVDRHHHGTDHAARVPAEHELGAVRQQHRDQILLAYAGLAQAAPELADQPVGLGERIGAPADRHVGAIAFGARLLGKDRPEHALLERKIVHVGHASIGLNLGMEISAVASSNTTSTGMLPRRLSFGASTLLTMIGPSSSAIIATL